MAQENPWDAVYRYTATQLAALCSGPDGQKADLAELRRGLGKAPGEEPRLWGIFLSKLPPELYSRDGEPSWGEWAVYTALTLFALHQQGRKPSTEPVNRQGVRLGQAVAALVEYDNSGKRDDSSWERIQRRLIMAASARNIQELSYHLRSIIRLLRDEGQPLDYPVLAKELYLWQTPQGTERIKLQWAEDFYRNSPIDRKSKEEV